MYNNKKIRNFIFGFLAFAVLTSKNIIIYNEETLVALAFLGFIFFVYKYFGDAISSTFDERREVIKSEYVQFFNLKQESLTVLTNEHKKGSKIDTALLALTGFTVSIPKGIKRAKSALAGLFSQQMNEKLNILYSYKNTLQNRLQHLISQNLLFPVLVKTEKI